MVSSANSYLFKNLCDYKNRDEAWLKLPKHTDKIIRMLVKDLY